VGHQPLHPAFGITEIFLATASPAVRQRLRKMECSRRGERPFPRLTRLKALYRSWGFPAREGMSTIRVGVRRRAQHLYEHLDLLKRLRQQVRRELLVESRKHTITAKLRQIPCVGPIRAALLVALIQTPHRFRAKEAASEIHRLPHLPGNMGHTGRSSHFCPSPERKKGGTFRPVPYFISPLFQKFLVLNDLGHSPQDFGNWRADSRKTQNECANRRPE
jgi:hypothetical protein